MNIIKLRNLVVTWTQKKGHIKFTGKIMSMTGKSKCRSRFAKTAAVAALAENNKVYSKHTPVELKQHKKQENAQWRLLIRSGVWWFKSQRICVFFAWAQN